MDRDLTKADSGALSPEQRSIEDRQSNKYRRRSDEEKFLNGGDRFAPTIEIKLKYATFVNKVVVDRKVRKKKIDQRSGIQRRSMRDRRCGIDTRSEVERFLQGERRSGADRRSDIERRYQSFKKARAFARDLGLISIDEWRAFCKSGMKPDSIPIAPHYIYANDGWLGWHDWFGASEIAMYLSRFQFFKNARTLAYGDRFGLSAKSAMMRLLKVNRNI